MLRNRVGASQYHDPAQPGTLGYLGSNHISIDREPHLQGNSTESSSVSGLVICAKSLEKFSPFPAELLADILREPLLQSPIGGYIRKFIERLSIGSQALKLFIVL